MSAASVRLNDSTAMVFDPVRETAHTHKGVLLTLEGRGHGQVLNCAVIPLDKVREVIATLQLVAQAAELG